MVSEGAAGKNADFGGNTGKVRMFCSQIKPIFGKILIMSTAAGEAPVKRKKTATMIPDYLIYEVAMGRPNLLQRLQRCTERH